MDKFGIFNLLNSFLNLNSSSNTEKAQSSPTENQTGQGLLDNILSIFNQKNSNKPQADDSSAKSKSTSNSITQNQALPLQHGMLKTITTHDEFVKRVKNKQLQK